MAAGKAASDAGEAGAGRGAGDVAIAVLMPHAPVLVPDVAGEEALRAAPTMRAMREAARRVVASGAESLVAVSPHSPSWPGSVGVWAGRRLRGSLAQFGAPDAAVELPADAELAAVIAAEAESRGLRMREIEGGELDHGAVVPLWFLARAGWSGPGVVLGLAEPGGEAASLGEAVAAAATRIGRRVALLASGDMSHRLAPGAPAGFDPRARSFDRRVVELLERGAYRELQGVDPVLRDVAGEDALESLLVAAAAIGFRGAGHEVLGYDAPFGVGYGVAVLFERPGARRG
jgi:aromatic ring-opening dioxygenase LigB subunit